MVFLKDRIKINSYNFVNLKILLLIVYSFLINCFFCNLAYANNNYRVMLPQKIDGIKKIEYFINDVPYGSTTGTPSIDITEETKLNFLVQFESFGYSQIKVKDVKINSNNNDPVALNIYGYDGNGNITTLEPDVNAFIDPSQTYISSPIWISSSDTFSFSGVEVDKYNVIINLSDNNELIDESVKVKYQYTNDEILYAEVDSETNTLKIPNVTLKSSLKLWFDPTLAYSNSVFNVYKSGEKLKPNENDNSFDIYIYNPDTYIEVTDIKKNQYTLNFIDSDDTSFKFKNKYSNTDPILSNGNPIIVTHGENYFFTCESPNLDEAHEITVNNNVIRPENGIYNINNISENLTISLIEKNSAFYSVSLENILNFFDVTDTQNNSILSGSVKYSDSFEFKVSPKEAYTQNEQDIIIYAVPISVASSENLDEQLEPYLLIPSLEGVYTTPSITEPMVIIARNMTKNSYKVTLPKKISGASYKVTENENVIALSENQFQVTHGESLEISLLAQAGYDVTNAELLTDNKSAEILKSEETHILQNVTSDTYLTVYGIQTAKCKVTFDSEGFICKKLNNVNLNLVETFLDYESEELKFKIELAEGYKLTNTISKVSISEGEGKLTLPSTQEDYYTLSNVHTNVNLSVTGAEPINLTLTISSDNENLEFKPVDTENTTLPKENSVKYGENFTFKVIDKNNETLENLKISSSTVSTPIKISESPLTYSINNISENTELIVSQTSQPQPFSDEESNQSNVKKEILEVKWLPAQRFILYTSNGEITQPHWTTTEERCKKGATGSSLGLKEEPIDGRKMFADVIDKGEFKTQGGGYYKIFYNDGDSVEETAINNGNEFNEKSVTRTSLGDAHISYKYQSGNPNRKFITIDQSYYNNNKNFEDITDFQYEEEILGYGTILDENGTIQTIKYVREYRYLHKELILKVTPEAMKDYKINFQTTTSDNSDKPVVDHKENYKIYEVKFFNSSNILELTTGDEIDTSNPPHDVKNKKPFYFVLELDEGYEYKDAEALSKYSSQSEYHPSITKVGQVLNSNNRYLYKVENVFEENVKININDVKKKEYTVNLTGGSGTKIEFNARDETLQKNVEHGDNLTFNSLPLDKFEDVESYLQIKSGNISYEIDLKDIKKGKAQHLEPDISDLPLGQLTIDRKVKGLEYNLKNIKGNLEIIIRRNLKSHNISFPIDTEGIEFLKKTNLVPLKNIEQTSQLTFSFIIKAKDGYDISNIKVAANKKNLKLQNGYYTITIATVKEEDNNDEIEVSISGVSKQSNVVSFNSYENVTYKNSSGQIISDKLKVDFGENLSFSVSTSGAYSGSTIKVFIESGNSTEELKLNEETDLYTINNIKNDHRVLVKGLEINKYTLKFRLSDKVGYYDQYGIEPLQSNDLESEFITKTVNYGETFGFKILANEGTDISDINVWYAYSSSSIQSSSRLLPVNDIYYIENITNDVVVYVGNTKKVNYQVEIRTTEGVKCLDTSGNILNSQISVSHGENLSFTLSLDPAYNNASPIVSIKGSTNVLSPSSNGIYTLENIKENKIIEVTNVTKNTYRIKFKETEGVIYRTVKNKNFTEYLDAEYGDVQQFKISLLDAYDQSSPIVFLNNSKILNSNGGIYTIENVEDNLEVTVENVVKNPEETTMEDINNVPESIVSSSDIDKVVAATRTYESLPEEQKILVTNTSGLTAAQEEAKNINHTSNEVKVTGIDWNIKLIVDPLTNNAEAMENFNSEIERRTLLSLYEIKLLNLITNEYYTVPYGQEVSVTIPCFNLEGYENIVIVHKNSGGGIEYLDANINENTASFKTSSFSQFGIAGKKIPNYSENLSDLKISVSDLVENEEELQNLLGEGLTSQLGELINLEDNESKTSTNLEKDNSKSNFSDSPYSDSVFNKIYLWATNNEFVSVIIILLLGILIILLIIIIGKKKKEKEN